METLQRRRMSYDDYLAGGIGQYWIVDPENRCIEVFASHRDGWDLEARVDAAVPEVVVGVIDELSVELTLDAVLPE